ncbi:MAG: ferrochelatase [Gammaproteobacteria bacterium]|nr:ferrochelatase [Gammaproteobacteria bacterium]
MTTQPSTGILLSNLGSPARPDRSGVTRFLREFLSDPRVVELPRALWLPLLYGIILPLRSGRSAAAYRQVWTHQGSPLVTTTQRQAELLQQHYDGLGLPVKIAWGMRYGAPNLTRGIETLLDAGCRRILLLPLYPQYAASTTASTFDAVTTSLKQIRHLPDLRSLGEFHAHPAYIQAVAAGVRNYWAEHGRGDKLLLSFHGLPKSSHTNGDPYYSQCLESGRLIAEVLELDETQCETTFQSRFGRAEWLQPYTGDRLLALGKEGTTRLDVACPGFVADCLETLEEIAVTGRDSFVTAGGGELHYIPALNEDREWICALGTIGLEALSGWV